MAKPKTAAGRLEAARAALATTNKQLAEVEAARTAAILGEDDATARELDAAREELQREARIQGDRVVLLEAQARDEDAARRTREREGSIRRAEAKFAERDAALGRLGALVAQLEKEFRKAISLSGEIDAAWPWAMSDRGRLLLTGTSLQLVLAREFFRISHRPFLGGRPGEQVQPSLPGSQCSRPVDMLGFPEREPSLVAVAAEATALGSSILRSGAPLPEPVAAEAMAPAAAAGNGEAPTPVRSPDQAKLASLLKQQALLAEDPAAEAEYQRVVAEIAALS
jgi:hypothetical protein